MGTVEATVRTLAFALHELGTLELRSDMSNVSAVPKIYLEVGDGWVKARRQEAIAEIE